MKTLKSVFIFTLSLIMVITMSAFAFAAEDKPADAKPGSPLFVVDGMLTAQDGRKYAPYDALFKALSGTSSYDRKSNTVTGSVGDATVSFVIGEKGMTVNSASVPTDAAAFADSATGTVYIPLRYTAQALGYVVGWDSSAQQITLTSVDDLIAASGATYTVFDKYLAYQKSFSAKNHEVSGTFGVNMDISALDGSVPLAITGSITGLTGNNNADLRIKMKSNISAFAASLPSTQPDAQAAAAMAMLENLDMNVILNSDTGLIYLKSTALSALMSQDSNAWMSLNLNSLIPGMPLNSMMLSQASTADFKESLTAILKGICVSDSGNLTVTELQMINAMLSDQALVKDGDRYISTFGINQSGLLMTVKMAFSFNGNSFNGVSIDMTGDLFGQGTLSMNVSSDAAGSGTMKMKLDIASSMTMDATAAFTNYYTTQSPLSQPSIGSTIIPIDNLLTGLVP